MDSQTDPDIGAAGVVPSGDNITVGNLTNAQGVAVGRHSQAHVVGPNSARSSIDADALKKHLESLYDNLAEADLPQATARTAQTSAGNAINAAESEGESSAESVMQNVRRVGETLKEANVIIEEGSGLWDNVMNLGSLLAPLVGGASIVAGWFGISL